MPLTVKPSGNTKPRPMITFIVSIALLVAGYFIYGKIVERYLDVDSSRKTPAYEKADGVDYTPIQQILYNRYNHRAPTVITTNLHLQDIKDRYGERMIDRMEETYTRICFDYPSYRSKK